MPGFGEFTSRKVKLNLQEQPQLHVYIVCTGIEERFLGTSDTKIHTLHKAFFFSWIKLEQRDQLHNQNKNRNDNKATEHTNY